MFKFNFETKIIDLENDNRLFICSPSSSTTWGSVVTCTWHDAVSVLFTEFTPMVFEFCCLKDVDI